MRRSPSSLSAGVRAWLGFAAAMLVFALLTFEVVHQQYEAEDSLARAAADQQLHLLSLAVHSELERSQYQAAASLINDWGASSTQVAELSLIGQSGETIAKFQRPEPSLEGLRLSTAMDYAYNGRAILKLHFDLTPTRRAQARIAARVLGLYLLGAGATAALVHLGLRRRQALEQLREASEQLNNYFNHALDLFCIGSLADGRARRLNARWEEVLGRPLAELRARPFLDFVHPDDREAAGAALGKLAQQQPLSDFSCRLQHQDGSYRTIEWAAQPRGSEFFAAARDVTERERRADEIRFLNRMYSTLSETNQLIVRCTDEALLFQNICRIAVEFGGMRLAWIGKRDEATARIVPVASHGERKELLSEIVISTRADLPEGKGPAGTAYREGQSRFVNDFMNDPGLAYWRDVNPPVWAWGSLAALPIRRGGDPYAVLMFYDTVPHSFSGKIVDLLREMASDIEYALVRIDLEAHKQRAEEELRIAAIAFQSQDAKVVTDVRGDVLRVNAAFTRTTGYTQEEVAGTNPNFLRPGRHSTAFFEEMWSQVHASGFWQGEVWDRRKNGDFYPTWLTISSVRNERAEVTHFVASFSDTSEHKETAAAISRLAYYDSLTGLPNRQLMLDRLDQAVRSGARSGKYGAILFLDLDNFKTINDTLGHDEGDKLLQDAAQRLKASVREEDTIARFGGDEFVVLLEDLDGPREKAALVSKGIGDKLLAALSRPYELRGQPQLCSASIGVTIWRGAPSVNVQDLMKRSDLAMYEAKKAGRNAVRFFDPIMQTTIENRTRLESRLRHGLVLGQFKLYFQAQVNSAGDALGAEALLRWQDPEHGTVSPAEFIPIAEESDLILPIGHWVLLSACRQLRAWAGAPATRGLRLSVNISPKQFNAEAFVSQVSDLLAETEADPALLQLEITEGLLLTNIEETIAKMAELRQLGVTFALDDFGTGYSSLSYLQRLPLDMLKIDQSFVQDVGTNKRSEEIVRTIIQMGQSLGLDVLAEGVETEQQRILLAQWGCSLYQGYLFGRPGPIETFRHLSVGSFAI